MAPRLTGRYTSSVAGGQPVEAFIPAPLPPRDPALALAGKLTKRLHEAEQALARLELAGELVPSIDWLLYAFVRKEAVLSSQIEGTQASLIDLFNYEAADGVAPSADVEEVCNYLEALAYARQQLASPKGLPVSVRLLAEAHRRLMRGVRGGDKAPGKIRRVQNWVGGRRPEDAVFVPPPPQEVTALLGELERYIHAGDDLPLLLRAGLVHVQFETIHPFLDGNGRVGRLLIGLLLERWGLLQQPLLYLSLFFKRHRAEYYRRLNAVRTDGDWEGWLAYFLDGVATTAGETVTAARDLFTLVAADRSKVLALETTSLASLRLFELLPKHPVVTAGTVQRLLRTTKPTAGRAVDGLVEAGVLVETTGKRRDRAWSYRAYLDRLRDGTDLDASTGPAAPARLAKPRRTTRS